MIKQLFKIMMGTHTALYRLTKGRFGSEMRDFRVLLLTTTGRKSGKERTTPLGYFDHDGGYVITASNAGLKSNPDWYHNLRNKPQVTIQLKDKVVPAIAEITEGDLRNQLWQQLITEAPSYADYEKTTTRTIPVVVLRPVYSAIVA